MINLRTKDFNKTLITSKNDMKNAYQSLKPSVSKINN